MEGIKEQLFISKDMKHLPISQCVAIFFNGLGDPAEHVYQFIGENTEETTNIL